MRILRVRFKYTVVTLRKWCTSGKLLKERRFLRLSPYKRRRMELLLNLGWLLLAMPALWLWRESVRTPGRRRFSALQSIFCLACALVVLFPVISATDDLRVMRAEMEESPSSKRSIGHSSNDRGSGQKSQAQAALTSAYYPVGLFELGWLGVVVELVSDPTSPALTRGGRAPPLAVS